MIISLVTDANVFLWLSIWQFHYLISARCIAFAKIILKPILTNLSFFSTTREIYEHIITILGYFISAISKLLVN